MIHIYDNIYLDADEYSYQTGELTTTKRKDKDGNIQESRTALCAVSSNRGEGSPKCF
jgi:hypothetical protein